MTPASNYRFPDHYSSPLLSGLKWSLRITSLFKKSWLWGGQFQI